MDMLWQLLRTMRPHQWVKNLFLFAPLVFAQKLFVPGTIELDLEPVVTSVLAFAFFSVMSGSVYILNDLVDRQRDQSHPVKRKRPIASGRLPVPFAKVAGALLTGTAVIGAFAINASFAIVMLSYYGLNVAYSFKLKNVPFVDVAVIATGFLLRILAGAEAIEVPVTLWLYACTFLLALYLGLGKRKHELAFSEAGGVRQRKVLARYKQAHVDRVLVAAGALTAAAYVAYTLSEHTYRQFDTRALVLTVPFIVFGLWRFAWLLNRPGDEQSPTDRMLHDPPFIMNLLLWAAAVMVIVYRT